MKALIFFLIIIFFTIISCDTSYNSSYGMFVTISADSCKIYKNKTDDDIVGFFDNCELVEVLSKEKNYRVKVKSSEKTGWVSVNYIYERNNKSNNNSSKSDNYLPLKSLLLQFPREQRPVQEDLLRQLDYAYRISSGEAGIVDYPIIGECLTPKFMNYIDDLVGK